jgi:hypothetical protein
VSQAMEALDRANHIRSYRARLKEQIKAGEVDVADVLAETDNPEEIEGMSIAQILMAQDRWGKLRTRKLLVKAEVNPLTSLGKLTRLQRARIVERLP